MQLDDDAISLALAEVELAALERLARMRRRERMLAGGDAGELLEKFAAPGCHRLRQLRLMIGKVEKGSGSGELLSLKEQRSLRLQQQERRHRARSAGARELMDARAGHRIRDLIVILQIADEAIGIEVQRWRAAPLLLPAIPLSLVEKAVQRHRREFVRSACVVGVVGLPVAGERDLRGVMPVVVPEHVDSPAIDQSRFL